jgi:hypothetical protein
MTFLKLLEEDTTIYFFLFLSYVKQLKTKGVTALRIQFKILEYESECYSPSALLQTLLLCVIYFLIDICKPVVRHENKSNFSCEIV